jgi:hypothetical protein
MHQGTILFREKSFVCSSAQVKRSLILAPVFCNTTFILVFAFVFKERREGKGDDCSMKPTLMNRWRYFFFNKYNRTREGERMTLHDVGRKFPPRKNSNITRKKEEE